MSLNVGFLFSPTKLILLVITPLVTAGVRKGNDAYNPKGEKRFGRSRQWRRDVVAAFRCSRCESWCNDSELRDGPSAKQDRSHIWAFVSGEKRLRFGFLKLSAAVPAWRGCFQHTRALGTGQTGQVSIATIILMHVEVVITLSGLKSLWSVVPSVWHYRALTLMLLRHM